MLPKATAKAEAAAVAEVDTGAAVGIAAACIPAAPPVRNPAGIRTLKIARVEPVQELVLAVRSLADADTLADQHRLESRYSKEVQQHLVHTLVGQASLHIRSDRCTGRDAKD